MSRHFDPTPLVRLPSLTSQAAIALATKLQSAAKGKKLPAGIASAHKKMVAATVALSARVKQRQQIRPVSMREQKAADRVVDAAWRALYRLLEAWQTIPGALAEKDQAAAISAAIFDQRLRFLRLPYNEEWTESETRIVLIAERWTDAIEALGGAPFLVALKSAHAAYGVALGITAAAAPAEAAGAAGEVNDLLDQVKDTVRTYILRVSAHADADQPETVALKDALLQPLSTWQVRPRAAAKGKKSEPAPAPTPPATAAAAPASESEPAPAPAAAPPAAPTLSAPAAKSAAPAAAPAATARPTKAAAAPKPSAPAERKPPARAKKAAAKGKPRTATATRTRA